MLTFRALSKETTADYFYFFDDIAFCDHPEWSWCYCTFFHTDAEFTAKEDVKCFAQTLIDDGKQQGFLAYEDGAIVGWCNAGDKRNYEMLVRNKALWFDDLKVYAVVCFTIAPDHRRKGVSKALLEQAVETAKAQGYDAVEVYPLGGDFAEYMDYHGPIAMYMEAGFSVVKKLDDSTVMRKML